MGNLATRAPCGTDDNVFGSSQLGKTKKIILNLREPHWRVFQPSGKATFNIFYFHIGNPFFFFTCTEGDGLLVGAFGLKTVLRQSLML